jgi:hypothetical protein
LQREAPVGAVAVVVLGELDEDGPQMSLVDDDQVIKAVSADRANEPLRDGIRTRRPERCSDAGDPQFG